MGKFKEDECKEKLDGVALLYKTFLRSSVTLMQPSRILKRCGMEVVDRYETNESSTRISARHIVKTIDLQEPKVVELSD